MQEITADNAVEYLQHAGLVEGPAVALELAGGVSNVVLRVTPEVGAPLVLKQSRELLRTRAEWRSRLDRIWREADVMRWLERLVPGVAPRLLFEDRSNYLIVMEAIDREHVVWKEALLRGQVDLSLGDALGTTLAEIHSRTWSHQEVAEALGDAQAFDELRLDPYYRTVARAHPQLQRDLDEVLVACQTRRRALTLGDFSPKNILLTPDGLRLVDFETGHYGDPAFDLGFFLTHIALKGVRAGSDDGRCFQLAGRFWTAYAEAVSPVVEQDPEFARRCVLNWAGCLIARIDGKSPVDYLDADQQQLVRQFVVESGLDVADTIPAALAALQARL